MRLTCKLCNESVENVEEEVDSVTCSDCLQKQMFYPLLEKPQQQPTRELATNEFYLVISNFGDVLKTKFKPELNEVVSWEGVVFCEKVKTSQLLVYQLGQTLHKKSISSIPTSQPYSKNQLFDFNNLDLFGGSHIREVWIEARGGQKL